MNTKLATLENKLKELNAKKESLEKEIAKEKSFNVGDYVVFIDSSLHVLTLNKIYKVLRTTVLSLIIEDDQGIARYYDKNLFRKATSEEIEKHLRSEAEKAGFKIGAKVKYENSIFKIKDILLISSELGAEQVSLKIKEFYNKHKTPFFVALFEGPVSRRKWAIPLPELELIKDEDITIEVGGGKYIARFNSSNYVTFGCAKIAVVDIKDAWKLLNRTVEHHDKNINRKIEAVKIGNGVFTYEILNKLVARINGEFTDNTTNGNAQDNKPKPGGWIVMTDKLGNEKVSFAYRLSRYEGNGFYLIANNREYSTKYSFDCYNIEVAPSNYPKYY